MVFAMLLVLMFVFGGPCTSRVHGNGGPRLAALQFPPQLELSHEAYVTERFHESILEYQPVHATLYLAFHHTSVPTTPPNSRSWNISRCTLPCTSPSTIPLCLPPHQILLLPRHSHVAIATMQVQWKEVARVLLIKSRCCRR
jgi:hypothetical protein